MFVNKTGIITGLVECKDPSERQEIGIKHTSADTAAQMRQPSWREGQEGQSAPDPSEFCTLKNN